MSEKIKKGGTSGEKECAEKFIDAPISVTASELRRFADILQALAEAAEVGGTLSARELELDPHKRAVRFRVCDLKIVDTKRWKQVPGTEQKVEEITGCEITPNQLTRGESYCLCNDTEDRMHVEFDGGEISPADFSIDPGGTIAISVRNEETGSGLPEVGYTIGRVDEDGVETICSKTGGPKMGIQDPPDGG